MLNNQNQQTTEIKENDYDCHSSITAAEDANPQSETNQSVRQTEDEVLTVYNKVLDTLDEIAIQNDKKISNLTKVRKKHGLTQDELAIMLGMTKQGLSFNERVKVSLSTAKAVAEFLGENVFDVLGESVLILLPKTKEDRHALVKTVRKVLAESIANERGDQ